MNFMEAIQALKEGKKVRRSCWPSYVYLRNLSNSIRLVSDKVRHDSYAAIIFNEVEATDWELFKEPKKTLSDKLMITANNLDENNSNHPQVFCKHDVKSALKEFIINSGMINNTEYKELAEKIFGKELI